MTKIVDIEIERVRQDVQSIVWDNIEYEEGDTATMYMVLSDEDKEAYYNAFVVPAMDSVEYGQQSDSEDDVEIVVVESGYDIEIVGTEEKFGAEVVGTIHEENPFKRGIGFVLSRLDPQIPLKLLLVQHRDEIEAYNEQLTKPLTLHSKITGQDNKKLSIVK